MLNFAGGRGIDTGHGQPELLFNLSVKQLSFQESDSQYNAEESKCRSQAPSFDELTVVKAANPSTPSDSSFDEPAVVKASFNPILIRRTCSG